MNAPKPKRRSRAKEPSSYAGIAGIGLAIAQAFPSTAPYMALLSAIAGAAAVYLREGKSPDGSQ